MYDSFIAYIMASNSISYFTKLTAMLNRIYFFHLSSRKLTCRTPFLLTCHLKIRGIGPSLNFNDFFQSIYII